MRAIAVSGIPPMPDDADLPLRDRIALRVLPFVIMDHSAYRNDPDRKVTPPFDESQVAERAYQIADEMMKQRNQ